MIKQQKVGTRRLRGVQTSVADPGCFNSDPGSEFFHPGSRIRIKEFKYFNSKNCFYALGNMIRVVHPGSGSRYFTHPGSKGQKGTGSRIRIRNTALDQYVHLGWTLTRWTGRRYDPPTANWRPLVQTSTSFYLGWTLKRRTGRRYDPPTANWRPLVQTSTSTWAGR